MTRSEPMRSPRPEEPREVHHVFLRAALAQALRLFGLRAERALARQLLDQRRGDDVVLAEVALVVALHLGEPVDVVHHQARGARHACSEESPIQFRRSSDAPLPNESAPPRRAARGPAWR